MLMPTNSALEKGKLSCQVLIIFHPVTTSSVVEYANYDDMKNALRKLDGVELKGRKLRLIEDSKGSKKKYTHTYIPVIFK